MSVNNSLVQNQEKEMKTMSSFLMQDVVRKKINNMLGSEKGDRFVAAVSSAVTVNPSLQECTQLSILNAALLGESLNLSPSPQLGQYYLVPFNDKKQGKVAQFQLGYKGYIQLAIRSGYYTDMDVMEIKQGEYLGRNKFTGKQSFEFIEDDEKRENLETIGYMSYFEYANGFRKVLYWTKSKMEAHALKYSRGYESDKKNNTSWTFWSKDFDGMAFKTMLRQLISKWGIMSSEMQKAFDSDMANIKDDGTPDYIDNSSDIVIPSESISIETKETVNNETKEEVKTDKSKAAKVKKAKVEAEEEVIIKEEITLIPDDIAEEYTNEDDPLL